MSKPVNQHIGTRKSTSVLHIVKQLQYDSGTQGGLPLFSTALIHFSTKLGTVVLSCAHSVARWQPNTLSAEITFLLIVVAVLSPFKHINIKDINIPCYIYFNYCIHIVIVAVVWDFYLRNLLL